MISPKEYFDEYLSWKRYESSLRSAAFTCEPYSAMDLETLKKEAAAKNPAAMEELGERHLFGLDGLEEDVDTAAALFAQAAAAGDPDAMHMEAELYRTDDHGKKDYDKYFPLLKKAAEGGAWKSMFNLACAYYKGKDAYEGHGFDSDPKSSLIWSTHCGVMTMGLLEQCMTNPCSDAFGEAIDGIYQVFVYTLCVSARQLIRGDGVEKDLKWAAEMLRGAQSFHQHFFKSEYSGFTTLLAQCDQQA